MTLHISSKKCLFKIVPFVHIPSDPFIQRTSFSSGPAILNMMNTILISILLLLLTSTGSVCAHGKFQGETLEQLLPRFSEFSIFTHLLHHTKLYSQISTRKNATIFAPTDSAFYQTAVDIRCPEPTSKSAILSCFKFQGTRFLKNVLTHHVVLGEMTTSDLGTAKKLTTLLGATIRSDGTKFIGGASQNGDPRIVTNLHNLDYNSGIVHGIDRLLWPSSDIRTASSLPLFQALRETGKFNIFLRFLDHANMSSSLVFEKNVTVFAPTDYGFRESASKLGCSNVDTEDDVVNCLCMNTWNEGQLRDVVMYHVMKGSTDLATMLYMRAWAMRNGVPIYRKGIIMVDQEPSVKNARLHVDLLDIQFNYGIIHGTEGIFLPFRMQSDKGDACATFERPVSLVDGSFLEMYLLMRGVRRCPNVKAAIADCDVNADEVCKDKRLRGQMTAEEPSLGYVVAASKRCLSVVDALRSCEGVVSPIP